MKWTKRLKWIRISKFVIPIALAVSIVFAGVTAFATEANNFVIRINNSKNVALSLAYNEDFSDSTTTLQVPVNGNFRDVTWDTSNSRYAESTYADVADSSLNTDTLNLPNDIARQHGVNTIKSSTGSVAFFAFSFYLVSSSSRDVKVDMSVKIEDISKTVNDKDIHVDGALRFMLIQQDAPDSTLETAPYLTDLKADSSPENASLTVYKKAEVDDPETVATPRTAQQKEEEVASAITYKDYTVEQFVSDDIILEKSFSMSPGEENKKRFTVVMWLEGNDSDCEVEILPEIMKMSMTFTGS